MLSAFATPVMKATLSLNLPVITSSSTRCPVSSDLGQFAVLLVDPEVNGHDVRVLAEGDALRLAVAQVAIHGHVAVRVLVDEAGWPLEGR
jgi:hypothetical protein